MDNVIEQEIGQLFLKDLQNQFKIKSVNKRKQFVKRIINNENLGFIKSRLSGNNKLI